MPGFTEFRKQVEDEADERVDENTTYLKENHPNLYEEMRRNEVPMDPTEFKEQGYKFGRDSEGNPEVWYPTEEYKDYLAGEGERPRRQYRSEQEKNEYEATEKIRDYVEENYRWVTGARHNPNEYEVSRITKEVSNILPIITGSDEQIKTLINEAVREGIEQQDLRPDAKSIYKSLIMDSFDRIDNGHWREPDDVEIKQQANDQYGEALEDGIDDILERRIDERISKLRGAPNYKYWQNSYKIADRIANTIIGQQRDNTGLAPEEEDQVRHVAERIVEELSEENKKQIGKEIADKKGVRFWVDKIAESPQAVEEIFAKYEIDRCDLGKFEYSELVREYSDYRAEDEEKTAAGKEKIVSFFNLTERLKEDFVKDGGVGFGIRSDGGIYVRGKRFNVLDERLSLGIKQIILNAEQGIAEKIKSEESLREIKMVAREGFLKRSAEKVIDDLSREREFDFDFYLSKGPEVFNVESSDAARDAVWEARKSEPLGYFMDTDRICESLSLEPEQVEIDYKALLRSGLLGWLHEGERFSQNYWSGKREWMLLPTEIFDTDGFRENQERLGIDLSDPEVAEIAFPGFINILQTRNGALSDEASWYYDNIFANDPERFDAMVKSYRDSGDCERGDKGRLTKFYKNNPRAFEDRERITLKERFRQEINDKQHLVKHSVMRDIPEGEFKKKLDEYAAYLLQRKDKRIKDIGSVFNGDRISRGKEKETDSKDRHEIPFDFALDKVRCFEKYASFIEQNITDGDMERFSTAFVSDMNYDRMYDADNSFVGIEFKYGGKWCAIAESIGATGSMYVFRGNEQGEYLEMFDGARFDKRRSDDPRFVAINHLDTENFDDSLDLTYRKALWFLKSGDKRVRSYSTYDEDNDSAKGKKKWEKDVKEALPAWPLGIDGAEISETELTRYHAWQEHQMKIQERLKKAKEQGGPEGYRKEQEQIAREAYERALEETAE